MRSGIQMTFTVTIQISDNVTNILVRNCHLISKDKHFAERFIGLIRRISDTEGGYIEGDLLLLSTSINSDAWIAILLEILFYITKPSNLNVYKQFA